MISPINIATRGYTAFLNVPLSIATDGYMSVKLQGGFPHTGGGKKKGGKEKRVDQLKREDEEILFILKAFIKQWDL